VPAPGKGGQDPPKRSVTLRGGWPVPPAHAQSVALIFGYSTYWFLV
jgi:hypothetical protein